MRIGQNPTKFARHNKQLVELKPAIAMPLSMTTVTYVPHLSGYYREGLDVLRLTLEALRKSIPCKFDLMIFDNGSCPEAVEFLNELKEEGVIQWLCLSSTNMKKLGAWNYLFSAAQGDFVGYFDSDILHLPGWYEDTMKVFDAYPKAGVVSAVPVLNADEKSIGETIAMADADPEIKVSEGKTVPEDWLLSFAEQLGADPEHYVEKKRSVRQVMLSRGGVEAYALVWHAQFMVRGDVLRSIFPLPRDWATGATDADFDRRVNNSGYMRLATVRPHLAHLGNTLTSEWRKYAPSIGVSLKTEEQRPVRLPKIVAKGLRHHWVRKILLRIHAWTFNLIYNNW